MITEYRDHPHDVKSGDQDNIGELGIRLDIHNQCGATAMSVDGFRYTCLQPKGHGSMFHRAFINSEQYVAHWAVTPAEDTRSFFKKLGL